MDVSVEVEGLKQLERQFNKKAEKLERGNSKALTDVVLDLAGESIRKAPVDLGDLRGSGQAAIEGQVIAKGNKDGNLTMSGIAPKNAQSGSVEFTAPYARIQHERLDFKHPQGGEAKYLENPFRKNSKKYIDHIADAAKKSIE